MSAFADSLPWVHWPADAGPPVVRLDGEAGIDRMGLLLAAVDVVCGVVVARQLAPAWAATADMIMHVPEKLPAGPLAIHTSVRVAGQRHLVDVSVRRGATIVAVGEVCLVRRPTEVPPHRQPNPAGTLAGSVVRRWVPDAGPLHANGDAVHDGGLVEGGLLAMFAARLAGTVSTRPTVVGLRFLRPASPGLVQGRVTTTDRIVVELEQWTDEGHRAVVSAWCR